MSILLHQLAGDQSVLRVGAALHSGARCVLARGVPRVARGALAAALFHVLERTCLVVVPDSDTEDLVAGDAGALLGDDHVLVFPSRDIVAGEAATDVRTERERLAVLEALTRDTPLFIVASIVALAQPTVPPQLFRSSRFEIREGEEMDRNILAGQLVDAGYERVDAVEQVGQFSVRGGIVDVYPPSGEHPCRLEFFGDMIESIRVFEIATQRSKEAVKSCLLSTPHEVVLTREATQRAMTRVLAALASRGHDDSLEPDDLEATTMHDLANLENLTYFPKVTKYLALLYPERPTLLDHLPSNALAVAVERHALETHLRRLEDELDHASAAPIDEGVALPLGERWMLGFDELMNRVVQRATVFITVGDDVTTTVDEWMEDEGASDTEAELAVAAVD